MPRSENWLNLTISEKCGAEKKLKKPSLFFFIPKKKVKLAIQRNRIKRLIREAIRDDQLFKDLNKIYKFRLLKLVDGIQLKDIQEVITQWKKEHL